MSIFNETNELAEKISSLLNKEGIESELGAITGGHPRRGRQPSDDLARRADKYLTVENNSGKLEPSDA